MSSDITPGMIIEPKGLSWCSCYSSVPAYQGDTYALGLDSPPDGIRNIKK